jgi:hypothetical protein
MNLKSIKSKIDKTIARVITRQPCGIRRLIEHCRYEIPDIAELDDSFVEPLVREACLAIGAEERFVFPIDDLNKIRDYVRHLDTMVDHFETHPISELSSVIEEIQSQVQTIKQSLGLE